MSDLNPFSVAYLTEASLTTDDLLSRYSFLPFQRVQAQLSDTTNVFLVGRKGVGKTMILKVYDPEFQRVIYESDSAEHKRVRAQLPASTIGVYLNLAAPTARLTLFQGRGHNSRWWMAAYADFINSLLLDLAFEALVLMRAVPNWVKAHCTEQAFDEDRLAMHLLPLLREESSAFDGINTIAGLRAATKARVQHWARYVNKDPSVTAPPAVLLSLGVPLFRLVAAARAAELFQTPFRLFLLVDQYESLYQHRRVIDFRPLFNQAMYEASRGGTGVEFKVGTRQYSYTNLSLIEGGGRIESGREMIEVHLDDLSDTFYNSFAKELFTKRMASVAGRLKRADAVLEASHYLPEMDAMTEAARYVGASSTDSRKHFGNFIGRWEAYGISRVRIDEVLGQE